MPLVLSGNRILVCIQVALIFAPYLDDRSESNHMPVISRFLAEKKNEEGQSRFLVEQGLVPYAESDVDGNFSSESHVFVLFPGLQSRCNIPYKRQNSLSLKLVENRLQQSWHDFVVDSPLVRFE